MLEIEVKAKLRDPESVRKKLEREAKFIKSQIQEDAYFNHPSRDFAETDEAMRIRKQGKKVTLTYKGPKIEDITKTREEYKIDVSDYDETKIILEKIGFTEVHRVKKRRDYYELKGFKVMLDNVEGLGDYIEIEKPGESYEPKELINFLKDLDISENYLERRSYLELLLRNL